MKICAVVFTYPGDYLKAARLPQSICDYVDKVFFCIESKDVHVPIPQWATQLVVDFDRCYQLHGTEAIIGMKRVYKMLVEMGYDAIVKIDSDTVVFRPEQIIKPLELGSDYVYIRRIMRNKNGAFIRRANGCCYGMSANLINALHKIPSKILDDVMIANDRHEDLVFSNLFTEVVSANVHDINKLKVWWSAAPYREPDCIIGHFGYCDIDRIKEEIAIINPPFYDKTFSKYNEDYCKMLTKYCAEHNVKLKQYENKYTKDGKFIESGNSTYPPPPENTDSKPEQKIKLPENIDSKSQ